MEVYVVSIDYEPEPWENWSSVDSVFLCRKSVEDYKAKVLRQYPDAIIDVDELEVRGDLRGLKMVCKYFNIKELVDEGTYQLYIGHYGKHYEEFLWRLFDPNLLVSADWFRNRYGVATINNWHLGGSFSWSGLRTPNSSYYSPNSQHSCGCAVDIKFKSVTAEDVRQDIKAMQKTLDVLDLPPITRIEEGVSWLHIDTRETCKSGIYFFNP